MSPFAALHGLRVGCVQYLNAKPLIVPYDGPVLFEHPARLADMLAAGEVDVALVPAFEALRQPLLPIVDGVAIASRGPVYSVFLAHCGPLAGIRSVSLDPASRTSNSLARCILAEFHSLTPACDTSDAPPSAGRGRLLIGNQAIRFREQPHEGVEYLDLGDEWLRQTGLPFVFAVWQIRQDVESPCCVARALRAVKTAGLKRVREIARLQRDFDPVFAERYLTDYIRFDMGAEEKAGLNLFRTLLHKHRLIDSTDVPLRFV